MSSTSDTPPSTPSRTAAAPGVPSPCRSLCRLDADDVCTGCGRTLDDIREWRTMAESDKRACVERAKQRRLAWGDAA